MIQQLDNLDSLEWDLLDRLISGLTGQSYDPETYSLIFIGQSCARTMGDLLILICDSSYSYRGRNGLMDLSRK